MSYKQRAIKYLPIGYWDITSGQYEQTQNGSANIITKANTIQSNRSIVYGITDKSCMLSQSNSTITIPITSNYYIAKTGYESKPFTINFWYQHLSDTFSSNTPVMSIGTDIQLYFSGEKFYMNFRGATVFCSVTEWRDLFFISVVFDGSSASLLVNDATFSYSGTDSKAFSSNTSIVFASDANSHFQIGGLGIYNYAMTRAQVNFLNNSTIYEDQYYQFSVTNNATSSGKSFYSSDISTSSSLTPPQLTLRNCKYSNNSLTLNSKTMASVIGSVGFSTTGATFSANSGIKFSAKDLDSFNSSLDFSVSGMSTASGTLFYIKSETPIYGSMSSGTLTVYNGTTALSSVSVGSNTSISLIMVNGSIYIKVNSTTTNLQSTVSGTSFEYIVVGNNEYYDDYLQTAKIRTVSINYADYPLTIGKYKIDLNNNYGSVTLIKPLQDGVAAWNYSTPDAFESTSVEFKSSSNSSIKSFIQSDADLLSDINVWLQGQTGAEVISGTSLKESDGTPITDTNGSVLAYITAYLYDDEKTSNVFSKSSPHISNMMINTYENNTVYSENGIMYMSSTDQDAYIVSDADAVNSKKFIECFKVYNDSLISFTGIPADTRTISIRMRLDDVVSVTGSKDIILLSGTTSKLTANYSAESYVLSSTNITSIYVDGVAYSGETLYRYNDYIVTLIIPSQSYTDLNIQNMAGIVVNSLDLFESVLTTDQITEQATTLKSNIISKIYDASNTGIFGGDSVPVLSVIDGYSIFIG